MKLVAAILPLIASASASCLYGTSLLPRSADGTVDVASYGYTNTGGPLNWHGLDKSKSSACAKGKNQSPINIVTADIDYAAAKSVRLNIPNADSVRLENLGTGLQVALTNGTLVTPQGRYTLAQFHFHTPSEHRINEEYYPMEAHFVFENTPGSLAVVGFVFELSESGSSTLLLDSIFAHIDEVATPGSHTETGHLDFSAVTAQLNSHAIYQYSGSLTTPPCKEGVTFYLSTEPLPLDVKTYNAVKHVIKFNSRYTQNAPGQDNLLEIAAKDLLEREEKGRKKGKEGERQESLEGILSTIREELEFACLGTGLNQIGLPWQRYNVVPEKKNEVVYLPRLAIKAHATILSSVSRTVLTQTYTNPSKNLLEEVSYTFPLYDGVSVVGFNCQVGDRTLNSRVKPRKQAKAEYDDAVSKGESAALMAHSLSASDVFSIRLGNVGPGEKVVVEITFVGELKQDVQTDAVRYTLPNSIAPRYGYQVEDMAVAPGADVQGISITVDVQMESTAVIREIQSTSHSLSVALGRVSVSSASDPAFNPAQASASVNLKEDQNALSSDFVLLVKADGLDTPRAMMETHPTIPNQWAIMTTLVPKFGLDPIKPEIIFVVDRSGSMSDKVDTLKSALRVFLKSLPVGVFFNICSFGSSYSFLWPKSLLYTAESLQEALRFVDGVSANMGGTEMQQAVEATVHSRTKDQELEVLILTDGQIWNQQALFKFIRETASDNSARFFSLGIGNGASHSLVEGIARAGNGFSQLVVNYEELDRKVVRMLKGALTPHISDYKLDVEYDDGGEDFEVVLPERPKTVTVNETEKEQQPISLFDADYTGDEQKPDEEPLPDVTAPQTIQAPYKIPPLYPFIRTAAYLLLGPATTHNPKSLIFRGTSKQGPLVLRIPIDDIGTGETIHQLAVRKAMIELEEGHGWLTAAYGNGNPFNNLHPGTKERVIARECEKLGTQFQVTGKHCSFVALEKDSTSDQEKEKDIADLSTSEAVGQQDTVRVGAIGPSSARAPNRRLASKACRKISSPSQERSSARLRERETQAQPPPSYARFTALPTRRDGAPVSFFGAPAAVNRTSNFDAEFCAEPPAPGMGLSPMMTPASPPARAGEDMMMMETEEAEESDEEMGFMLVDDDSDGAVGYSPASPPMASETAGAASKVHRIIALQSFEGYWTWSAELMNALGVDEQDIRARLMKLFQEDSRGSDLTVIATMLAMAYLSTKCAADRSVWELVYDKAQEWKRQRLVEMGESGAVLRAKENEVIALI
ncbi:hypothetical protein CFD26_105337 [Aspergillus turcosus]|uniref:carbonic anhydrase n=1 Tax=Aspergillus turcosus TaxID=1245748 RepID=A0A421D4Z4_9EURO|nr:hypothetical protein CFD26_105337 [Aspergillus turcosus]